MSERRGIHPQQKAFDMQLRLPEGTVITIVSGQAPLQPQLIPRVNPVDVERRYPKEPAVDPELISHVIETFRLFGDEHEESQIARQNLGAGVDSAIHRGFSEESYLDLLERVFAEATRDFDGAKMGQEHSKIIHLREVLETEAVEKWESPNP